MDPALPSIPTPSPFQGLPPGSCAQCTSSGPSLILTAPEDVEYHTHLKDMETDCPRFLELEVPLEIISHVIL